MKYILSRKLFENQNWSPLLDLEGNIDYELIDIIESLLPNKGKILEISCGNGTDAIELSGKGYDVTCTENNQGYYEHVSQFVKCIKHDTRNKFPFEDKSFDLVYSRLGLHYFSKEELSSIFSEISRLSNYLVFSVKIEQDDINTGKVILSKEDWEELLSENFNMISSESKEGILYDKESKWLEIAASVI
jgi:SAM-dependent methyltransferase